MATCSLQGPPIRRLSLVRSAAPAPCPFCGTSCLVKIWAHDHTGDGEGSDARVQCGRCLAQGPIMDSVPSAVRGWNMRREVSDG